MIHTDTDPVLLHPDEPQLQLNQLILQLTRKRHSVNYSYN